MSEKINQSYLGPEKIHTDCGTLSSSVKRDVGLLCSELDQTIDMLHRTRTELRLVCQENEVLRRILRGLS